MDDTIRLDTQQEAALDAAARSYVQENGGSVWRSLKAQMLLNARLQQQVENLSGELKYPRMPRRH